jgi:mannose-6-phosphate isomerase-like protein (cupin superfamily)
MLALDYFDFTQAVWQPHPTLAGIQMQHFTPLHLGQVIQDLLLAKVEVGQQIPWHVHLEDGEVAYILSGLGYLLAAERETLQDVTRYEFQAGVAVVIGPRLWHSVYNTGSEPLLIFALHTPPK